MKKYGDQREQIRREKRKNKYLGQKAENLIFCPRGIAKEVYEWVEEREKK
jgi:hypothetical protein